MWRIVDHTKGRILAALKEHWSERTANGALECSHGFGAVTDIAHELTYLGFEQHKDFDINPARTAVFLGDIERLQQNTAIEPDESLAHAALAFAARPVRKKTGRRREALCPQPPKS